jgi:hypothetical protein
MRLLGDYRVLIMATWFCVEHDHKAVMKNYFLVSAGLNVVGFSSPRIDEAKIIGSFVAN